LRRFGVPLFGLLLTSMPVRRGLGRGRVTKLRTGEVIRVRDAAGALVFSSDENA
jgi:hypothetical protein